MVNLITSQNTISPARSQVSTSKTDNIKTLVKYINNEALKETPDTFKSTTKSAISTTALFEGLPIFCFLKRSKLVGSIVTSQNKKIAINDTMKLLDKTSSDALINVFKGKGSITSRVANYISTVNKTKQSYQNLKKATKTAAKAIKKSNPNLIKEALEAADEFVLPGTQEYNKAIKKVEKVKQALRSNPTSKKLEKALTKATKKANKLNPLAKTAVKQTGKLGKAAKFLKSSGASSMLIFSGIWETLTEVVPTFKELGAKKGLKQLGKSALKVIGDTAGFVAGEQAGMAIGATIGSVVPGVGTVVGGVLGFALGMVGSFAVGKITKKITGPTEREIVKEQKQQQVAEDLANTDLSELKAKVMERVQEEVNTTGTLSEDSQIALQTLENIENENPFATT